MRPAYPDKTTWDNWRERTFARLLASVDLAGAVPYDLRHSFASLLLHEGRSVHYVARQLGHGARLTLECTGTLWTSSTTHRGSRRSTPSCRRAAAHLRSVRA